MYSPSTTLEEIEQQEEEDHGVLFCNDCGSTEFRLYTNKTIYCAECEGLIFESSWNPSFAYTHEIH